MTDVNMADVKIKLRRFLRLPQVQQLVGHGRSWIYAAVAKGEFPKPIKLGPQTVAWDEEEIAEWQAARIAERDMVSA